MADLKNSSNITQELDDQICQNLKDLRLRSGLTQKDLAKSMGVAYQQIQKYESKKNRIMASRLFLAAKVMNVSVGSFFHEETGFVLNNDELKLIKEIRSSKNPEIIKKIRALLSAINA